MTLVYYLSISTVGTAATDWANDNLSEMAGLWALDKSSSMKTLLPMMMP